MGQSLCNVLIHLIDSTKHHRRLIAHRSSLIARDVESALHGHNVGVFKGLDSPGLTIGGTEDPIDALFLLCQNQRLKDVITRRCLRPMESLGLWNRF